MEVQGLKTADSMLGRARAELHAFGKAGAAGREEESAGVVFRDAHYFGPHACVRGVEKIRPSRKYWDPGGHEG